MNLARAQCADPSYISNPSHVEVKFTSLQLKAICAIADLDTTNKISTLNTLASYLITVLNRISLVAIVNV
jgi:hypothetical protein